MRSIRSLRPLAPLALTLSALLALAHPAAAQLSTFTLVDEDVRYTLQNLTGHRTDSGPGSASLETNSTGSATNHLFQEWFWYRAGTDTREYALSNQVAGASTGNHAHLVYLEPANNGAVAGALRTELEFTLSDLSTAGGGIPIAVISVSFTLRNLTAASLPVSFFAYADTDLAGTSGNDSGRIDGAAFQTVRIRDDAAARPTQAFVVASATGHSAFQLSEYSDILTALADPDTDDLSNAPTFGPGDLTCAHQWAATLAPAGNQADTLTGSFLISVTVGADTCTLPDADGNGLVQPADIALFVNKWFTALTAGCP